MTEAVTVVEDVEETVVDEAQEEALLLLLVLLLTLLLSLEVVPSKLPEAEMTAGPTPLTKAVPSP